MIHTVQFSKIISWTTDTVATGVSFVKNFVAGEPEQMPDPNFLVVGDSVTANDTWLYANGAGGAGATFTDGAKARIHNVGSLTMQLGKIPSLDPAKVWTITINVLPTSTATANISIELGGGTSVVRTLLATDPQPIVFTATGNEVDGNSFKIEYTFSNTTEFLEIDQWSIHSEDTGDLADTVTHTAGQSGADLVWYEVDWTTHGEPVFGDTVHFDYDATALPDLYTDSDDVPMASSMLLLTNCNTYVNPRPVSGLVYYIDDDRADDTGDGSTWGTAKKSIWGAIVEYVGTNPTSAGVTFEISGGASGKTYPEVHNLYLSEIAANYTGDTPTVPTTTGFPDGTLANPIIIQGSGEEGHRGLVTLNSDPITNFRIYNGVIASRVAYVISRNIEIERTGAADSVDHISTPVTGATNYVAEDMRFVGVTSHATVLDGANSRVSRCFATSVGIIGGTSSTFKFDNSGGSLIEHCEIEDVGGSSGVAVHFGIQFRGGTGHRCVNNTIVNDNSNPFCGTGLINGAVVSEMKNNSVSKTDKSALYIETGTSSAVTNSDNNSWQHDTGRAVALASLFSTNDATFEANITNDYTLAQWQASTGTPDLNATDVLPTLTNKMPNVGTPQYRTGEIAILTTEGITEDINNEDSPQTGQNPNMGAYETP